MLESLSQYIPVGAQKKKNRYYEKSIARDIEMLKYLYMLDLTNVRVSNNNKPETLQEIFEKSKELCDKILSKQTRQFTNDPLVDFNIYEGCLNHLVLETFLSRTIKDHNESVSLTEYIELFIPDNFTYKHFARMYKTQFRNIPFYEFMNVIEKSGKERTSYKMSTYLSPMFSRVINSSEKCPYYILSLLGTDNVKTYSKRSFIKYFEKYLYGKYIGKKPVTEEKLRQKNTSTDGNFDKQEYEFAIWQNNELAQRVKEIEEDPFVFYKKSYTKSNYKLEGDNLYWEVLSYFVLDGFYDLSNIIDIAKRISEPDMNFPPDDIAKSICPIILIPNNFIKQYYIQTIFEILDSFEEVKKFDFYRLYFTEKELHKTSEIRTSNLLFCRKYINYLATVYFPLLIKCFEIIYYNSTGGDVTLLKKYIKKHKLLDYYKNKTSSSIQALKDLKHSEYIQVLKMYKYIEEYIFNNETTPKLKYLLSANYSSFAPYMSDVLSNITANKTLVDENSFTLPI